MMILLPNQLQKLLKLNMDIIRKLKILEVLWKSKFNDGRKKWQSAVTSKLIYNPSSAAPGFITKNVFSLPGVPSILNSMIEN